MPDGNGGGILSEIIKGGIDWIHYVWMLILALWGGTVSYLAKISREGRRFKVVELLAQWITSGFAGLLAGYICLTIVDNLLVAFIFSGMAGKMGSGALVLIERWAKGKLSVIDPPRQDDDDKR